MERLLRAGKCAPGQEPDRRDPDRSAIAVTIQNVCGACEFREQDCDFAQDRNARPCGGFEMLARLLGSGIIAVEDIT